MFFRLSRNLLGAVVLRNTWKLRSCRWISLQVFPADSLIDELLTIKISELVSGQRVTVSATLAQEEVKHKSIFWSYGHFMASSEGKLDLSHDPSLSGTYTGVEPMGLFWSMDQYQGNFSRLLVRDSALPATYNLTVYENHVTEQEVMNPEMKPLTSIQIRRWYKKPLVQKIEVAEGNIRGFLFLPENTDISKEDGFKPPAIIDLFGGNGGLMESRAALLASNGFKTLSLAYFRYKDIPSDKHICFEYFKEAIDWFTNHPSVANNRIGMLGSSYGGAIAVYMAAHCPNVKAAISINGPPSLFPIPFYHHGIKVLNLDPKNYIKKLMKYPGVYQEKFMIDESMFFDMSDSAPAKVLYIIGDDDAFHKSDLYRLWLKKISLQKANDVDFIVYPGTGHLIDPPYTPLGRQCYSVIHKYPLYFGGEKTLHAVAQEKAWLEIQRFFREHLCKESD